MLKDRLDKNAQMQKYLFRRGYLITNRENLQTEEYPFYGNWNKTVLTNRFCLYVQKEQHFYICSENGTTAVLIGHAYDPFTMEFDENTILSVCLEAYRRGRDAFFDKVSELTGIHLIAVFEEDRAIFVQDCSGMAMCCYGFCGENVYITSNSALVADVDSIERNPYVEKLLKSKSYRHGSKYLPGDLTPYQGIARLGPNIFLELEHGKFRIERFYPAAKHPSVDENNTAVVEEIARLVKNSVKLCAKKWERPAISLSGGVDSRTTLSSASECYDRFRYYSFYSKPQEENDAAAAHNICTELGLKHRIYPISEEIGNADEYALFRDIVTHNSAGVSTPKDHEIRKYVFLSTLDDFEVELKSWASEIGRAFWERRYGIKLPDKLLPRHFSIFQTRYFGEPALLRQSDSAYGDFMKRSGFTYPMYNYEHSDLFYWEYRFGSWGTIVTTGQNVFNFEVTMPMNNRKIMDMFLWYPHDFRRADLVNKGIVKQNDTRLLEVGNRIHNDYLNKKRLLLERVYYYYRTVFCKK